MFLDYFSSLLFYQFTWANPAFCSSDQWSKHITVWMIPASSNLTKPVWSDEGNEDTDNDDNDDESESITTTVLWLNLTSLEKWNIFSVNICMESSKWCFGFLVLKATFPSNNLPWPFWQIGWRDRRSDITPLRNGVWKWSIKNL